MAGITANPTTALLASDLNGSIQRHHSALEQAVVAYLAYGHRFSTGEQSSRLGFNGQLQDQLTGCYLLGNGYRAYSPTLMRFVSADNLSPFARGGINAYCYCSADPVNAIDSSGHMKITKVKIRTDQPKQLAPEGGAQPLPRLSEPRKGVKHFTESDGSTYQTENLYKFDLSDGKSVFVAGRHKREFFEIVEKTKNTLFMRLPQGAWAVEGAMDVNGAAKALDGIFLFGATIDADSNNPKITNVQVLQNTRQNVS